MNTRRREGANGAETSDGQEPGRRNHWQRLARAPPHAIGPGALEPLRRACIAGPLHDAGTLTRSAPWTTWPATKHIPCGISNGAGGRKIAFSIRQRRGENRIEHNACQSQMRGREGSGSCRVMQSRAAFVAGADETRSGSLRAPVLRPDSRMRWARWAGPPSSEDESGSAAARRIGLEMA